KPGPGAGRSFRQTRESGPGGRHTPSNRPSLCGRREPAVAPMVYAALSKGWRRPGKKLVNDPRKCAMDTATYSGELKVTSQDVARPSAGAEFMLILRRFGPKRRPSRARSRFVRCRSSCRLIAEQPGQPQHDIRHSQHDQQRDDEGRDEGPDMAVHG